MRVEEVAGQVVVIGDCLAGLEELLEPGDADSIVTDPPYGLGFMGKSWDALPPGEEWARAVLRVLRPGGHLVSFGGQRTIHRLACALEDGGFEIRDLIGWLQYQGFPKSVDLEKAVRKEAAKRGLSRVQAEILARASRGRGTALKPALEPAILARRPLDGTIASNALAYGSGWLEIDACRYPYGDGAWPGPQARKSGFRTQAADSVSCYGSGLNNKTSDYSPLGRFPANVYHCPKASTSERERGCEGLRQASAGELTGGRKEGSDGLKSPRAGAGRASNGRGNKHPTVKPIELMRWLVRLVTPPGGVVVDPFIGSGTTAIAALLEGRTCIGFETSSEYAEIALARIAAWGED